VLGSQLFAGDALLQAIADDLDQPVTAASPRISRTQNRRDPAVGKVQIALLGWRPDCLPTFGPDGDYGDETAGAVARFKLEVLQVPAAEIIDDVGPRTVIALDEIQAGLERPEPPPPPPVISVPEEWLLDVGEMGAFRSPAFTRDNAVDLFVDGESYMESLATRFDGLGGGDQVLMAGWRFSPDQRLRPAVPGSPSIQQLALDLHARGVAFRALVYGSFATTLPVRVSIPAFPSRDNLDFRTALAAAGVGAMLDARVARFGSHHQKAAVVRSAAEGAWAYAGGIDICLDRWDNAAHADLPARQREPEFLGTKVSQDGWHDVQCAVQGPAVIQVWTALAQRWNDPTPPSSIEPVPVPLDASEAPGPPIASGTWAVQVLRTLACNGIYSFLPGGERTVLAGYRKAIRRARHYIHIEDQYLWPSPVVDDLRDAAARGVQLVIVTSRDFDLPEFTGLPAAHRTMRDEAITRIASAAPGNVRWFHLERAGTTAPIYVHAKLMVVDDLYVAVGSANLNLRSHTTDSELQYGLFDTEVAEGLMGGAVEPVGRQIREFRAQLWGEHLNEDPVVVDDPLASLGLLPEPGDRRGHLVGRPLPGAVAPMDAREILRQLLRTIQRLDNWPTLATTLLSPLGLPLELVPGLDLAIAADLIPDPESFLRAFLNPDTICV
jgi:phosphatidylserine/phosphatidylglycerophosphate/cardiolipin synthase-like enzyme